jgi:NADH-quinone oxidoreductase subunit H
MYDILVLNYNMYSFFFNIIYIIIYILLFIIGLLICVAFYTLAERKLMGAIQRRKGPDVVGFWGLLQPLADGLKLLLKEIIIPKRADAKLFITGPSVVFVVSLWGWVVIPQSLDVVIANTNLDIFFTFVSSGLTVYGLILSGWASNSRYGFLATIRAVAQVISYELTLSMVNLIVSLFTGGFSYTEIVYAQQTIWFIIPLLPLSIIYIIIMLAETNRTPFDLAEAEAELVAGYNVEYSGMMFALFFLGEYANMLLLSTIFVIYFLAGWLSFFFIPGNLLFILKILCVTIIFIWVRATLPRYRYDQLMMIGWKNLLPLMFGLLFFYISIFITFNIRPDVYKSAASFPQIYHNSMFYIPIFF